MAGKQKDSSKSGSMRPNKPKSERRAESGRRQGNSPNMNPDFYPLITTA